MEISASFSLDGPEWDAFKWDLSDAMGRKRIEKDEKTSKGSHDAWIVSSMATALVTQSLLFATRKTSSFEVNFESIIRLPRGKYFIIIKTSVRTASTSCLVKPPQPGPLVFSITHH